jgi:endonuclease G
MNRYLLLLLLFFAQTSLFSQNFQPTSTTNQLIHHTHYGLSYSEQHEQAEWVYYELTASEASNAKYNRTNNFRADRKVTTGSASLTDYKGSGYDRGHLAPAGDLAFSSIAISESFYLSNMSPQHPSFNRGIWKQLESLVRAWATEKSVLYVATGAILETGLSTIGTNRVSIPRYYYKVLLDYDESNENYTAIGFILPNQKGQGNLQDYVVSIDDVEQRTGIDFYPQLSDDIENSIEANYDLTHWNWNASSVSSSASATVPASQCKGNTQKGARCKNKTKNDSGYCYLHESQINEAKSDTSPNKRSTSVRCTSTTKSGIQCKRKTLSSNSKCWQHGGN